MTDDYRLILACYLSGQMSEKQRSEHCTDKLFKIWLDHHNRRFYGK